MNKIIPALVDGEQCSMCRYANCSPGCDHSCHEKKPACSKGNCARPDGHNWDCRVPYDYEYKEWERERTTVVLHVEDGYRAIPLRTEEWGKLLEILDSDTPTSLEEKREIAKRIRGYYERHGWEVPSSTK